jgi:cytochrome P450
VPATLADIPGSDSLLELPRMLRDPIQFLRDRFAWHGPIFKTRWALPFVFLVGPDANKLVHVTSRATFSYLGGYKDLAFGRLFAGSLLLEDGETHQRDRDILQPAMGRLALQGTLDAVSQIWEKAVENLADGAPHGA